jgi:hypothetical protein
MIRDPSPWFIRYPNVITADPAPSSDSIRGPVHRNIQGGPDITIRGIIDPTTIRIEIAAVRMKRRRKIPSAQSCVGKGRIS